MGLNTLKSDLIRHGIHLGPGHLDSTRPTFSWKFRFYLSVDSVMEFPGKCIEANLVRGILR